MRQNETSQRLNTNVLLANPRGFCAGVDRAIIIVEQALEKFGARFMCAMKWYITNLL